MTFLPKIKSKVPFRELESYCGTFHHPLNEKLFASMSKQITIESLDDSGYWNFVFNVINKPISCVYRIYAGIVDGHMSYGLICLLCKSGPVKYESSIHNIYATMCHHLWHSHPPPYENIPIDKRKDSPIQEYCRSNMLYCENYEKLDEFIEDHLDNFSYHEIYALRMRYCDFICYFCGCEYAITPSYEVIVSHLLKCKWLADYW